jgi:hypothetical protein
MTKGELIQMINDEITGSGALPYSVPEREAERVIKQALNWFYVNYGPAVETQYYVIEKAWFQDEEFKKTRSILLPECVVSVYECKEISGGGRLGTIDRDFSDNRLLAAEIYLAPFASDDLVLRTAQYSYWDLTKAFILERVRFDYNRNTHRLKITGRNPKKNLFLETYVHIEEGTLYDDWFFQRWCVAQCKISLANIIGFFSFNLPGGIQVNPDTMRDSGKEELEEIKQKIDDENSPDWMMIFH